MPAPLRARFGLDEARGLVAVALAYGEGPATPPAWAAGLPGPLAELARFARADWYGELASRLRAAAAEVRAALRAEGKEPGPARAWRYLANSGLPERPLALAAGLGSLGRNGLLLVRGLGPGTVLGLLLLPWELSEAEGPKPVGLEAGVACGACRACVEACPTAALGPGGGFIRERCIQHWSTRAGPLPAAVEAAWGRRLYGCDACLEACPRFRPDPEASARGGLLGPGLPAPWLSRAEDGEIRAALRGSVLGQGWMDPAFWRRNAALALQPASRSPGRQARAI